METDYRAQIHTGTEGGSGRQQRWSSSYSLTTTADWPRFTWLTSAVRGQDGFELQEVLKAEVRRRCGYRGAPLSVRTPCAASWGQSVDGSATEQWHLLLTTGQYCGNREPRLLGKERGMFGGAPLFSLDDGDKKCVMLAGPFFLSLILGGVTAVRHPEWTAWRHRWGDNNGAACLSEGHHILCGTAARSRNTPFWFMSHLFKDEKDVRQHRVKWSWI